MVGEVPNRDRKLLNVLVRDSNSIISSILEDLKKHDQYQHVQFEKLEHPLDNSVIGLLERLTTNIRDTDDDYHIFNYIEDIKKLWKTIIGKSIKCLRFFDTREPFITHPNKHPIAYGVKELSDYFDQYSEFESMLYGGGKYYRDHVVHVFRVWLLGLTCLLDNEADYLNRINIQHGIDVNPLEKISIWSMIALTHDLGYPLEKSQEIIDKTKNMMKSFVVNPIVSMDLSFNGVQNNMNDFVIRFMSSKMHEVNTICPKQDATPTSQDKEYVARLQPKYYFKLQKSLEQNKHGILSSIIIYKLLIYFLESDFNINEDYRFKAEDARQFYIRREILRSIAAHTCHDIYHLNMLSFAYLLIIVDDAQEWGRKRLSELYVKSDSWYEFGDIVPHFEYETNKQGYPIHECTVSEQFEFSESDSNGVQRILKSLESQYKSYKEIFRDGQDTANRNFIFTKQCKIISNKERKPTYTVRFCILNEDHSTFEITLTSTNVIRDKDKLGKKFLEEIYGKEKILDVNGEKGDGIRFTLNDNDIDV